ncbi:PREDICTED: uncharacterized protein LOC105559108, partial [Vollenhovia emeryi]|uniref:uncharacterized protein LOC105559108 n=1 Tax=Vollenhovia emeryi TaxID=411798 RepID=UPI0005F50C5F
MDVKVLYTEPLVVKEQQYIVKDNDTALQSVQITDPELVNVSKTTCDSDQSKLSSISAGPGTISPSAPLPPLSFDLEYKVRTFGTLPAQKDLMYHWGSYLWQATAGQPSKRDYQTLATSIVKAYPSLGTSDGSS